MSILIYTVTALYALNKTFILIGYEDTNLTTYTSEKQAIDKNFSYEDTGFMFAIGSLVSDKNTRGLMPLQNLTEYYNIKAYVLSGSRA